MGNACSVRLGSTTDACIFRLAADYRVVYFDPRGIGLSDRIPDDVSLDGFVSDIETIFDVAALRTAVLFGENASSHPAIRFAARQPERVDALTLWGSPLSYKDWAPVASTGDLFDLVREARTEAQFDTIRQAFISVVDRMTVEEFRKLISGTADHEFMVRATDELLTWDATQDAASVTAPTLVLAREADEMYPIETLRPLAAAIPGARLLVTPGKGAWAFDGDPEPIVGAIEAGDYILWATSFLSGQTGSYELTLAGTPIVTCDEGSIAVGQTP